MRLKSNPEVKLVFDNYPTNVQPIMLRLRQLIIETAEKMDGIEQLEETLRWGEPSYITKIGSTLRMDWKEKSPDSYAIYFKCTSQLVPTFKVLYTDKFNFEKNRAILFKLDDDIDESALKHCIGLALSYHKIKHLPLLGAKPIIKNEDFFNY